MSVLHSAIADVLIANPEGLTEEQVCAKLKVLYVGRELAVMRRRGSGYALGVKDDRYFLAPSGVRRATGTPVISKAGKDDQACAPRPVCGSPSTEGKLFELPPMSHYEQERRAA